ncbi:Mu-like prophage major head subunit gpT family protein [Rhizobium sp. C1]|uniref:Mu-like prophage major head subunit gpT family protein n=1 Tax=Rhizobium sp. C1 TaxID=1349799 RepID=UPI001E565D9D|nr:Mu-like prophage major head subunit gpT family protein [Rhizobium sp. C1]MCD2176449.1 Mu-like prophage major head subunit gpT family protein [Rhizobium sp. C1]
MDINASSLRSIYTGLSTAFNGRFGSVASFYNTVAMTVNSTGAQNEYPRLDDLKGIREWVGERIYNRLGGSSFVIKNKRFEETITINRDNIADDQLGIYFNVAAQMGQNAAEFPDRLIFPLLKNGENAVCYDGQYFFDIDHPGFDANGADTVVSNFTSGAYPAWYLMDDSQVLKPIIYQTREAFGIVARQNPDDPRVFDYNEYTWGSTGRMNAGYGAWQTIYKSKADLNAANYEAARVKLASQYKRSGEPLNIAGKVLLVPPALEGAARKLIINERNDAGATNVWKDTARIVVIPHLA